ncbi:unnamed protein product [Heterobilharzia americana]|nr:unnamed protein product [Heterobilharzia americana]
MTGLMFSSKLIPTETFPLRLIHRFRSYAFKLRSFDPPYLSVKPHIHLYQGIQFDVTGHDYAQLEKFTSYIHKCFNIYGYEVDNFPLPPKKKSFRLYHANSTKIRSEFEISEFRRIYRISGLKTIHLAILLDLIYQNLPAGIRINVGKTNNNLDEDRFVPQLEKEALEKELSKIKS